MNNLNDLKIKTDGPDVALVDQSCVVEEAGRVEVVLRTLERRLCEEISKAEYVIGCVAWLTSEPILRALAKCKGAAFVMQKEDWLRPDGSKDFHKQRVRALYEAVPLLNRFYFSGLLSECSQLSGDYEFAFRCVGEKSVGPASPRAHHKFAIFCGDALQDDPLEGSQDEYKLVRLSPYRVWTGSFNFTYTAQHSFENAVIFDHPKLVNAYFDEFQQIAALSEPLDWEHDYVEPEWRIGT